MNTKTKRVITLIVTGLAAALVILSGIMKLLASPDVVATLTKAGVGDYIPILGIMEITFAALFLYPKTMKIGLLLLTAYFAGAMATELSHNGPVLNATFPLILVWVAAFLRDDNIFLPSKPAL